MTAKILDKIICVVDDNIHTLSDTNRILENLSSRSKISPLLYPSANLSKSEVLEFIIQRTLIRDKLKDIGYIISDDIIEEQIKHTEKQINANRDALLGFLAAEGISFNEYFELLKQTREFKLFIERVIKPTISISKQQIKNEFYKQNEGNKSLAFKYHLVDFSIASKSIKGKKDLALLKKSLISMQKGDSVDARFANIDTNVIEDLAEDGITEQLKVLLKKTPQDEFSDPVLIGKDYHVFFVKEKNLVESSSFLESKDKIHMQLFQRTMVKVTKVWYEREKLKHYVKVF